MSKTDYEFIIFFTNLLWWNENGGRRSSSFQASQKLLFFVVINVLLQGVINVLVYEASQKLSQKMVERGPPHFKLRRSFL